MKIGGKKTGKTTNADLGKHTRRTADDPLTVARNALESKKGEDLVTINLDGSSAYTDNLLVATATSTTHAKTLADEVEEQLRKAGHVVDGVEGTPNNQWILVDAGNLVVHIFLKEMRELYNIEKLYSHDFEEEDKGKVS